MTRHNNQGLGFNTKSVQNTNIIKHTTNLPQVKTA